MRSITPRQPEINPATRRPEIGNAAELPAGLDPARHRIIAIHFFGWRSVGVASKAATDARYLPPPPLYEVRG